MVQQSLPLKSIGSKIVATVGPACSAAESLAELIKAGVDVFRVNMAHGEQDEHLQTIARIRQASSDVGRTVGILVDLAGPKIRLGQLFEDPLQCDLDAEFDFVRGDRAQTRDEFVSNYPPLIDELSIDDRVMLADGTVSLQVIQKSVDRVRCRVTGAGLLRSRQGINLPGVKLSVPAMTEKDLEDAVWATGQGVDFISLSFVRKADDVHQLRRIVAERQSQAVLIAKIEKGEALECLDEIVSAADGIMVARGDLGVETDLAETPVAQKRIIDVCQRHGKPVIVATQMLDSMQHSRRPTRAEVSDVSNAILDGADACMLSGETAIGKFPVEAVSTMGQVMQATEQFLLDKTLISPPVRELTQVHPITAATVKATADIATQLNAKLIVIATHRGATARLKSKYRDVIPVIAVSDAPQTLRQMTLYWGINPMPGVPVTKGPELRKYIDECGRQSGQLKSGDRVVYLAVADFVSNAHNSVTVQEVS